jgi:hypothetical protein
MQPVMTCALEVPPVTLRRVARSVRRITLAVLCGLGVIMLIPPSYLWHRPHPRPAVIHQDLRAAYARAATLADAAFTRWAVTHPGGGCPGSMTELRLLASDRAPFDPWGGVFELVCEPTQIVVHSPGPDGIFGTADDVARSAPR